MKSRRVIINGVTDVEIIEEKLVSTPLLDDECLIKTSVSLISPGTELSRVYGLKKGATYPVYPGYCSVGTILEKSDNLSDVNVGDLVLFSGPHASHSVFNYKTSDGGILYKLDPQLTAEEGTLLMMCWIAMNGILTADVKPGDTVAIFGLGNLGIILSVYYKEMGVNVISLDPVEKRCEVARKMGIENIIACAPQDQLKEVMKLTSNLGADIVVDCSGISQCIETCFAAAAKNGQVILLGSPREEYTTNATIMLNAIHTKMLTVKGAFNRLYPYDEQPGSRLSIKRSLKYIEGLLISKKINADLLISHRIKPEEIMIAYDGLMNHKNQYTSVIINWE